MDATTNQRTASLTVTHCHSQAMMAVSCRESCDCTLYAVYINCTARIYPYNVCAQLRKSVGFDAVYSKCTFRRSVVVCGRGRCGLEIRQVV
mgnify:CR=1 FL=1